MTGGDRKLLKLKSLDCLYTENEFMHLGDTVSKKDFHHQTQILHCYLSCCIDRALASFGLLKCLPSCPTALHILIQPTRKHPRCGRRHDTPALPGNLCPGGTGLPGILLAASISRASAGRSGPPLRVQVIMQHECRRTVA